MGVDILGPANAPNAVTTRPADTRTFGTSDTWMRDCSSDLANDGTRLQAGLMNSILASLRSIVRGNGLTAASDPIVAENNNDDAMVLKGIQHLVQRGLMHFAIAGGTPNAISASLTPALAEYKAGLRVIILLLSDNTLAPTINLNGLGAKPTKHLDGTAIVGGELRAGMTAEFVFDGTSFQWLSAPYALKPELSANRDYYVNAASGSDTNDGLSTGSAFQHIQKAIGVASAFNLNGWNVTIHVADGTYDEGLELPTLNGNGTVTILGNEASPQNVLVQPAAGPAVHWGSDFAVFGWNLYGLKLSAPVNGTRVGACIYGGSGGVTIRNIDFGAAAYTHMLIEDGALTVMGAANGFPSAVQRISGSAGTAHMLCMYGGFINMYRPNLIVASAVSLAAFAQVRDCAIIAGSYNSITGAASVTSTRKFIAAAGGVIDTGGSGDSYFPGDIAGTRSDGGQYV